MIVETIQTVEALTRLAPEWERLPMPTPMQSPSWLLPWVEAYCESEASEINELCVLALRDSSGRLAGLAPWRLERRPLVGATLRWIGDGRASTDHHTLLCEEVDQFKVVDAVAEWLIDHAGDLWRRMRLEAIDEDDPTLNAIEQRLADAGLDTERISDYGSYSAKLSPAGESPSWDAFLMTLSKNRRKRLRKWQRELLESDRVVIQVATTEEERQAMWPRLVQLHRERREGMGEQGVFDIPEFCQFHEQASARLLAEGKLYFALLELDGEPAAVEYAPQDTDTIYAYQGGIASWALDQDVGHVSLMALVQQAIKTGRTQLDLLRGDEPYKVSWGGEHRPASTLHVRPRTVSGTLERWAGAAYRSLREVRRAKQSAKG